MPGILIVGGQEGIRRSLINAFKREGFVLCDGVGWKMAAELFGRNSYDLIIIDLDTKLTDGYEKLKMTKFANPGSEVIAIIPPNIYDTDQMSSYGAYDCVLKPFRQNDIVDTGKKALEKKQLSDKVRNLEQIMDMN